MKVLMVFLEEKTQFGFFCGFGNDGWHLKLVLMEEIDEVEEEFIGWGRKLGCWWWLMVVKDTVAGRRRWHY
ncbi:hypothetical protein D5086_002988 [Populus alba]|uniref:Uncharacterized protein n=1 Tax=Populus alba TaxID=43335 RepID=A0ACC4D3K6_POPAL